MAPASLAPGDRAEGDGGDAAEPPGRTAAGARPCATPAHPTDNHPAASPQLAPHARPRLEARRSAGAPLRTATPCPPGSSFQDRLLRDFYTTAVPGAIAPNPSASLWVTPATKDPRYNLAFVTNMLNYMLTVSPGRLCVVRVRSRVFRFTVSCQNIANVLAIRGTLCMGSSMLHLHATMAAAVRAAGAVDDGEVPPRTAAFMAQQPGSRAVTGPLSKHRAVQRPVASRSACQWFVYCHFTPRDFLVPPAGKATAPCRHLAKRVREQPTRLFSTKTDLTRLPRRPCLRTRGLAPAASASARSLRVRRLEASAVV